MSHNKRRSVFAPPSSVYSSSDRQDGPDYLTSEEKQLLAKSLTVKYTHHGDQDALDDILFHDSDLDVSECDSTDDGDELEAPKPSNLATSASSLGHLSAIVRRRRLHRRRHPSLHQGRKNLKKHNSARFVLNGPEGSGPGESSQGWASESDSESDESDDDEEEEGDDEGGSDSSSSGGATSSSGSGRGLHAQLKALRFEWFSDKPFKTASSTLPSSSGGTEEDDEDEAMLKMVERMRAMTMAQEDAARRTAENDAKNRRERLFQSDPVKSVASGSQFALIPTDKRQAIQRVGLRWRKPEGDCYDCVEQAIVETCRKLLHQSQTSSDGASGNIINTTSETDSSSSSSTTSSSTTSSFTSSSSSSTSSSSSLSSSLLLSISSPTNRSALKLPPPMYFLSVGSIVIFRPDGTEEVRPVETIADIIIGTHPKVFPTHFNVKDADMNAMSLVFRDGATYSFSDVNTGSLAKVAALSTSTEGKCPVRKWVIALNALLVEAGLTVLVSPDAKRHTVVENVGIRFTRYLPVHITKLFTNATRAVNEANSLVYNAIKEYQDNLSSSRSRSSSHSSQGKTLNSQHSSQSSPDASPATASLPLTFSTSDPVSHPYIDLGPCYGTFQSGFFIVLKEGIFQKWKDRFVVVNGDKLDVYTYKPKEKSTLWLFTSIPLSSAMEIVDYPSGAFSRSSGTLFGVRPADQKKVHVFEAPSARIKVEWLTFFKSRFNLARANDTNAAQLPRRLPPSDGVIKEGFLDKRGGKMKKSWQTRYFQLTPTILRYYAPKIEGGFEVYHEVGVLPLARCKVMQDIDGWDRTVKQRQAREQQQGSKDAGNKEKEFYEFNVTPDGHSKSYVLQCEGEDEAQDWVDRIQEAINTLNQHMAAEYDEELALIASGNVGSAILANLRSASKSSGSGSGGIGATDGVGGSPGKSATGPMKVEVGDVPLDDNVGRKNSAGKSAPKLPGKPKRDPAAERHAGYLRKRGGAATSAYKERYFILTGQQMLYYKSFKERVPLGSVIFTETSEVTPVDEQKLPEFTVLSAKGGRLFYFMAKDFDSRELWMRMIKLAILDHRRNALANAAIAGIKAITSLSSSS